jgi:hypothetical protein
MLAAIGIIILKQFHIMVGNLDADGSPINFFDHSRFVN